MRAWVPLSLYSKDQLKRVGSLICAPRRPHRAVVELGRSLVLIRPGLAPGTKMILLRPAAPPAPATDCSWYSALAAASLRRTSFLRAPIIPVGE